ncbi:hypothetical protein EII20_12910 [Comamonadaceae bacterium OH2545_COT-014]|nr:hypothetical protein EII20_12910 [Comamonadaceae bacterium OH2545_COT-014]
MATAVLIHRYFRRGALAGAVAACASALLAACNNCPADSAAVLSATREPLAEGTRVFSHAGAASVDFDNAIARLKELDRGQPRGHTRYCGQRLAAEEGVSDAAIVADLSRQLGQGWLAAEEVASSAGTRIYRWQSQCSARFYALVAHQRLQREGDGAGFRPLVSMYVCGAN